MPKVKNAKAKKSKKLVSSKNFSLSRIQLLLIVLVLSAVGVFVVYKSQAAIDIYQGIYVWNSTNYSGAPVATKGKPLVIHHHAGGTQTRLVSGNPNVNRTMWAGTNGGALDAVDTGYMWFGPGATVPAGGRNAHICWYFVPPDNKEARVRLDVTYNNGKNVLSSQDVKIFPQGPYQIPGGQKSWQMQQRCVDKKLPGASVLYGFEVRAKLLSGGSSPNDAFRLWRTSWQVSPKNL